MQSALGDLNDILAFSKFPDIVAACVWQSRWEPQGRGGHRDGSDLRNVCWGDGRAVGQAGESPRHSLAGSVTTDRPRRPHTTPRPPIGDPAAPEALRRGLRRHEAKPGCARRAVGAGGSSPPALRPCLTPCFVRVWDRVAPRSPLDPVNGCPAPARGLPLPPGAQALRAGPLAASRSPAARRSRAAAGRGRPPCCRRRPRLLGSPFIGSEGLPAL